MLEFPAIMHDDESTIPVIILAPSYERCLADVDHATGTGGLWDGWECLVLAVGPSTRCAFCDGPAHTGLCN